QGEGGWEGQAGASNSWYRGRIGGKNLADVLKGWGFAPTVTSEDFHLDVDGRWPGSPAWVGLKRYSGSLDATLRKGQFVEVEGGAQALRVFGLLNFNSIGRRLRLDFSDLFGKGLSYDRVRGVLVASNGVYVTREPITLTGPSSNLELNGTLDMVADQVDAKLL
ncbi:TIGR02099 family protein, partial [Pseudomonas sp. MWU13-2860]